MKRIVLVSCVKSKLPYRAKAKDLYTSTLFRFTLKYAHRFRPDAIYIVSAKYGLVELDEELDAYNMTLNGMGEAQKKAWAERVLTSLQQKSDLHNDHFIILAAMNYRKYITPHLHSYEIPLEGLSFGEQLGELKRWLS
jgi:hypothetical protein